MARARPKPKPKTKRPSKPGKPFHFTNTAGRRRIAKNVGSKTVPTQHPSVVFNESEWSSESPEGWIDGEPWNPFLDTLLTTTQGMCLACEDDAPGSQSCTCSLEAFRTKYAPWQEKFELKEVAGLGIGVFAKQKIGRGEVIGEHTGELHPPGHRYDPLEVGYYVEVSLGPEIDSEVEGSIDATYRGAFTRFVNHSCNPKSYLVVGRVGRTRVVAIMMKGNKGLKVGEEVTVSYGPYYFVGEKYCYCGYRLCKNPYPNA